MPVLSIAWRRNIEEEIVTDLHEIYMQKLSCRYIAELWRMIPPLTSSRCIKNSGNNFRKWHFFPQTDFVFFPPLAVDIPRESSWVMRSKKLVTLFTLLIHKSFFTDGILVKNAKHFHSTKRTLSSMLSLQSEKFVDFLWLFHQKLSQLFSEISMFFIGKWKLDKNSKIGALNFLLHS